MHKDRSFRVQHPCMSPCHFHPERIFDDLFVNLAHPNGESLRENESDDREMKKSDDREMKE